MVKLKVSEKQEDKFRLSRWEEIKTMMEDLNEMEIKRAIQGICTRKSGFFEKKNNQANGNKRKREDPNE